MIVVIGILATITIIAYNGIQSRANDSKIRTAASQIQKAIQLYHINTGRQIHAGYTSTGPITAEGVCPGVTHAGGFAGAYQCSLEDVLVASGLLDESYFDSLPADSAHNQSSNNVFMFYQCGYVADNKYALYWHLASPSDADAASYDRVSAECGYSTNLRDSYGMRAGTIVQL